eukprot:7077968-Pyramimonas_sp.AAC.1
MRRTVADECCDELKIFHGCTLADIEKFYDRLRLDTPIPEALRMNFSPWILTMLTLQHSSTRFSEVRGQLARDPC